VDTSGEDTLQMSPERAFDRRKKKRTIQNDWTAQGCHSRQP